MQLENKYSQIGFFGDYSHIFYYHPVDQQFQECDKEIYEIIKEKKSKCTRSNHENQKRERIFFKICAKVIAKLRI